MIVVTYLLRQSITLYKNLGGLEQNLGGLEPLSPIASAATAHTQDRQTDTYIQTYTHRTDRQTQTDTHRTDRQTHTYRHTHSGVCMSVEWGLNRDQNGLIYFMTYFLLLSLNTVSEVK